MPQRMAFVFQKNNRIFAAQYRGVVQLASILAWGASGRPFESGRSDKKPSLIGRLFLCTIYFYFPTLAF